MNFRRLAFAALAQMVLGSTIAMAHQDSRGSFENEQLPERDVPLALEVRDKVKDAAERFLGLSEVRFVIVDAKTTRLRWGDTTPSGLAVYPWSFAHGPIDLSMRSGMIYSDDMSFRARTLSNTELTPLTGSTNPSRSLSKTMSRRLSDVAMLTAYSREENSFR